MTTRAYKRRLGVDHPHDPDILAELRDATEARIGLGKVGTRPRTAALLRFWADHARSKSSVFREIPDDWLAARGLWCLCTAAGDKRTYLTRPDLGRSIPPDGLARLRERYPRPSQVQIVVSDGLSSDALLANYDEIVPPLAKGLANAGLTVGRPFFLRHGRVKAEDLIGEALGAEVVVQLIGERPGLGQSESLSCYAVYRPTRATMESGRTVISNIHQGGIPPVEAAAVIVALVRDMLAYGASGIELANRRGAAVR